MEDPEEHLHKPPKRVALCINNKDELTEERSALPREILIDILIRLPVKDLCKFRSVSKEWLVLLSSDPVFLNMHTRLSNTTPLLLSTTFNLKLCKYGIPRSTAQITSVDLNKGKLYDKFSKLFDDRIDEWISSRFGLICLVCRRHVYVCNPSTHEFLKVHLQVSYPGGTGLGFLPDKNEYKLVNLFYDDEDEETGLRSEVWCRIFTITEGCGGKSGSWRFKKTPALTWQEEDMKPLCVNGFMYWVASDYDESYKILSVDLEKEEFGLISCPVNDYSCTDALHRNICCLVELKGVLCLVDNLWPPIMDVWMLKDQENHTWVKYYSINFSTVDGYNDSMSCFPLTEVGGELLIQSDRGDLYYYNFENGIFKRVEGTNADGRERCVFFASFFALWSR